jgi:hypothetical protein
MPSSTMQPSTLAGASIVIQVCLLFISFVTLWLLSKSYTARAAARNSYSSLVLWLLLTLVAILMGEDLYATWGPILGRLHLPNIPRDNAFFFVFFLDIIFITVLILRTGGTKLSPFSSLLFLLPSLAIFLREPVGRFLVYSITVGIVYVTLLRKTVRMAQDDFDRSEYDAPSKSDALVDDRATMWTNITCLALVTLIGYITQPT